MLIPSLPKSTPLRVLATAIILITGCGQATSPLRKAVSGQIAVDGNPAPNGSISFLPARGTSGPAATSLIADGQYRFDKSNGPYTGAYQVVISFDAPPAVASKPSSGSPADNDQTITEGPLVDPKRRSDAKATSPRRNRVPTAPQSAKRTWELEFVVPQDDESVKNFALSTQD
ncbi:hypothetical protein SH528x_004559 [Novipirellula sp. SH528]|uniref:hypothetical protein n=1 Tax=Novipirellula sp. SH528 TaxID=3454466 RepID=UPI003FA0A29A